MSDTILEEDHPRIISAKLGWDWLSSFTEEDFFWWNDPWMALFQNCVRWSRLPTKMATKLKIEKMGDEILKNLLLCNYWAKSNDYLIKILFLLSKWFQTRRFLWKFPVGSYVKLSSAVVAILVGVLKCQTQFWKRTTQESFQQSLVEIGSVVAEEKIF
jgi:hypothetical protein